MRFKLIVVAALLMLIAFAAGFIPNELANRRLASTLQTAMLDLRLANLHRQLGVASHEAQRNNFTVASEAARVFFDGCRTLTQEYAFAGQPRTKNALTAYGAQGDVILGELANGDPMVKEKLASLYLTMNGVLARRQ
jgi:hypothetical protein